MGAVKPIGRVLVITSLLPVYSSSLLACAEKALLPRTPRIGGQSRRRHKQSVLNDDALRSWTTPSFLALLAGITSFRQGTDPCRIGISTDSD